MAGFRGVAAIDVLVRVVEDCELFHDSCLSLSRPAPSLGRVLLRLLGYIALIAASYCFTVNCPYCRAAFSNEERN
jgi:hypothetical protein